jgi:hypothetical protein
MRNKLFFNRKAALITEMAIKNNTSSVSDILLYFAVKTHTHMWFIMQFEMNESLLGNELLNTRFPSQLAGQQRTTNCATRCLLCGPPNSYERE